MTARRSITATGEYTPNVNGRWASDVTQMPAVVIALRTSKGSSPVAPSLGNRSSLNPTKITRSTPQVVENDCRDALSHLTASGLIWKLVVTCVPLAGGAVQTTVSFTDAAGPQSKTF